MNLNNGQIAACDVAYKHGIHKSLLTKWKKEENCISFVWVGESTWKWAR